MRDMYGFDKNKDLVTLPFEEVNETLVQMTAAIDTLIEGIQQKQSAGTLNVNDVGNAVGNTLEAVKDLCNLMKYGFTPQ